MSGRKSRNPTEEAPRSVDDCAPSHLFGARFAGSRTEGLFAAGCRKRGTARSVEANRSSPRPGQETVRQVSPRRRHLGTSRTSRSPRVAFEVSAADPLGRSSPREPRKVQGLASRLPCHRNAPGPRGLLASLCWKILQVAGNMVRDRKVCAFARSCKHRTIETGKQWVLDL